MDYYSEKYIEVVRTMAKERFQELGKSKRVAKLSRQEQEHLAAKEAAKIMLEEERLTAEEERLAAEEAADVKLEERKVHAELHTRWLRLREDEYLSKAAMTAQEAWQEGFETGLHGKGSWKKGWHKGKREGWQQCLSEIESNGGKAGRSEDGNKGCSEDGWQKGWSKGKTKKGEDRRSASRSPYLIRGHF